jgi:murein DD-endopeptidase MepM/ murein hydrolase activator NlpD
MSESTKKPLKKYRLTFFDEETLHEITSFKLTRNSIFTAVGLAIIIIATFIILLFVYTPLNVLIPSRYDSEDKKEAINNTMVIDSLKNKIDAEKKYLSQIKNILQGNIAADTFNESNVFADTTNNVKRKYEFKTSELDSILRAQIEKSEQENLSVIEKVKTIPKLKNLHFTVPIKGSVTNEFDLKSGHRGIDIAAGKDKAVLATLTGTVIVADWSIETGYMIGIQHDNDLISFYKHNSVLLKKQGDRVRAGESIAISGNSGEKTTGPHLHFELWYKGTAVNPRDFITF